MDKYDIAITVLNHPRRSSGFAKYSLTTDLADGSNLVSADITDVVGLAITALREMQARENPQPLTLEQVKERVGKPVWCEINHQYGVVRPRDGKYVVGFVIGWMTLEMCATRGIYDRNPAEVQT